MCLKYPPVMSRWVFNGGFAGRKCPKMSEAMRKRAYCLALLILAVALGTFFSVFAGARADAGERARIALDDDEQMRMSKFISCFTEVELFEIRNAVLELGYADLVYF